MLHQSIKLIRQELIEDLWPEPTSLSWKDSAASPSRNRHTFKILNKFFNKIFIISVKLLTLMAHLSNSDVNLAISCSFGLTGILSLIESLQSITQRWRRPWTLSNSDCTYLRAKINYEHLTFEINSNAAGQMFTQFEDKFLRFIFLLTFELCSLEDYNFPHIFAPSPYLKSYHRSISPHNCAFVPKTKSIKMCSECKTICIVTRKPAFFAYDSCLSCPPETSSPAPRADAEH